MSGLAVGGIPVSRKLETRCDPSGLGLAALAVVLALFLFLFLFLFSSLPSPPPPRKGTLIPSLGTFPAWQQEVRERNLVWGAGAEKGEGPGLQRVVSGREEENVTLSHLKHPHQKLEEPDYVAKYWSSYNKLDFLLGR